MKGNMPLIWQIPLGPFLVQSDSFLFQLLFCRLVAYFFELIMHISLKGILTQIRTKLDRVTFLCKGPMRSRYDVIMMNFQFYRYHVQLVFLETKS